LDKRVIRELVALNIWPTVTSSGEASGVAPVRPVLGVRDGENGWE